MEGRNRVSGVRARQERRRQRESMVVRRDESLYRSQKSSESVWRTRLAYILKDVWWYLRHTPTLAGGIAAAAALVVVLYVGSHLTQSRIFPNIWSFGTYIGDLTVSEAEVALLNAWNNDLRISLTDGVRTWQATTGEMGLKLNPKPIIETARAAGLSGIPFGVHIEPVVDIDFIIAQNYLLDLSQDVEIPPYNAGYELQNGAVVGIPGSEGRIMDVGLTLENLTQNVISTVERRRLDLIMEPLLPDFIDPQPYMPDVQQLVSQSFQMTGYDPYTDETVAWTTTPETLVTWLEAGRTGLTLREETFIPFMDAQTISLNVATAGDSRYLEPGDTMEKMRAAISSQQTSVQLRIRYRPTVYEVEYGDRAFSIARKTGIPYYLVEEANTGRDLNVLNPGDKINLPSRDVAVPLDPVPNKRIIVDIATQSLVAYENGQEVFNWKISTGISSAPTSPGVYQILNHDEKAYGSSFTLCGSQGCGQWEMSWFMGLYEVQPGLMNGFHGAVLLPNGTYLGGGNVGQPFTFGCVMSLDSNAKLLYDWADIGTPVEIVSREYPPQSELGRRAFPQYVQADNGSSGV
jgi:hypothetical protein